MLVKTTKFNKKLTILRKSITCMHTETYIIKLSCTTCTCIIHDSQYRYLYKSHMTICDKISF